MVSSEWRNFLSYKKAKHHLTMAFAFYFSRFSFLFISQDLIDTIYQ